MILSYNPDKSLLHSIPQTNYHSYPVSYIYGDEKDAVGMLEKKYNINLNPILKFDDEVASDYISNDRKESALFISFLLPELTKGFSLDELVTSVALIVTNDKLVVVTKRKIEFIMDLLSNFSLHDTDEFTIMLSLQILKESFDLMTNELRSLKKEIDKLENALTKSGPIKPVFSHLLFLQKQMIILRSTYTANKRVLDYVKSKLNELKYFNKSNERTISLIYDKIYTMNRIITSYSSHLDNLQDMFNNLSSYQLNMIMKTLTEISIVLTIPAIIYGLWGINVDVPFEKSTYGICFVIGISVVLSIIVWFWLRRKKYL